MIIKKQKGVALVVALMVTVIIGIVAITLASVSSKTQRSDNSNYGRVLGTSNAVSGVNRVINFVGTVSDLRPTLDDHDIFSSLLAGSETWVVGGQTLNSNDTAPFFRGVIQVKPNNQLRANDNDFDPWYRNEDNWKRANCPSCVILRNGVPVNDDGTTSVLTEYRGCTPANASIVTGSQVHYKYCYLRVSSRGLDSVGNQRSASIVQSNVRIKKATL
ncbi:hypothetical protein [Ruminobacter sp.]|jgi:hypothetical protein|uniref:hypothetical protein n=1 Tax=Ruminobacter sp. TaxID=2774296 RepID=UPI003870D2AF